MCSIKTSIIIIIIIIERWYEHKLETVTENEEVTILWDMHTDRELSANKPDIVIKDHANRCCKLIYVLVPSDRNTSTKVIEKLTKYKDLEIETPRMREMRTEDCVGYFWCARTD